MNNHQRNILKTYHDASADELRQGMAWYNDAHNEAKRLAELLPDKMVYRAAGIISALSPGLKWELTIEAAERTILGESLDGVGVRYAAHKNKAIRIAKGGHVESEFIGRDRPKTRAFWKLLCNPTDNLTVCVDVHAYGVWLGERIASEYVPHLRDRLYTRIAGDYVAIARELAILPCQLQAVCWVHWRNFWNVAPF